MGSPLNLIGKKFNRWTILKKTNERNNTGIVWIAKCKCGKIKLVFSTLQAQVEHNNKIKQKMRDFIKKANKIKPLPDRVKIEMETLKNVLKWLEDTNNAQ